MFGLSFFEENGGDVIPYLAWVVVPPSVSVICFCIGFGFSPQLIFV